MLELTNRRGPTRLSLSSRRPKYLPQTSNKHKILLQTNPWLSMTPTQSCCSQIEYQSCWWRTEIHRVHTVRRWTNALWRFHFATVVKLHQATLPFIPIRLRHFCFARIVMNSRAKLIAALSELTAGGFSCICHL